MLFTFPKNYNFKPKLFGFVNYSTVIFNILWFLFLFLFSKILNNLNLKISFIIIFYLPIFIFSIIGFNNENFFKIILIIFKFLIKPKLYLFNKDF
jgi:hypothetical protein